MNIQLSRSSVLAMDLGNDLIKERHRVTRIAEETSPCSDLPLEAKVPVNNALEAIAVIYAVSFVIPERDGYYKMTIFDKIAKMAMNHNYEGRWEIVQQLLETTNLPYNVGQKLFEHFSPSDIYGNLNRLIKRKATEITLTKPRTRTTRVKYPKRKRGYDDKGSLRPLHRWLPSQVHLGPNPEREDRTDRSFKPRNKSYWFKVKRKRGLGP